MLFTFVLVVQAIVAALLVTVILMQRSEGGGLTSGGGPSGLMSARGAANFLTRATSVLAGAFIILSIALAVIAANRHSSRIDASQQRIETPAPTNGVPLDSGNGTITFPSNATAPAPGPIVGNAGVPLGQ